MEETLVRFLAQEDLLEKAQSFQTRPRADMEAGLHFYLSLSFLAFAAHTLEQAVVPRVSFLFP